MAVKTQGFEAVTEAGTPDATNTAAGGDAMVINTPTGSPTAQALAAAAFGGSVRGLRIIGADTTLWSAKLVQTASTTAVARIYKYVDSARRPTVSSHVFGRVRSNTGAVCGFLESTTGTLLFQDRNGSTLKTFAAPANGWYYFTAVLTVNATTGTAGSAVVKLYKGSDDSLVDTYTGSGVVDLNTASMTEFHIGKILVGGACNCDLDEILFNTGTTTEPGPYVAPGSSLTYLKRRGFEGVANGTTLTTSNLVTPDDQISAVVTNGSIIRATTAFAINGAGGMEITQGSGLATNVMIRDTWSGSAARYTAQCTMKYSIAPPSSMYFGRGYSDAAYATPEFHWGVSSANKLIALEDGGSTVTSTGTLVPGNVYTFVWDYNVTASTFTVKAYQRGLATIQAQCSVTLATPLAINSSWLGLLTNIATSGMSLFIDDYAQAKNDLPARTDTSNVPPSTISLSSSKSVVEAGGSVTFTADAVDPDGVVVNATWTIAASAGVTAPTKLFPGLVWETMQVYATPALVDYQLTVTYTPIDDLGLAGDTTTLIIDVHKATDVIYLATGGTTLAPAVWYEFAP